MEMGESFGTDDTEGSYGVQTYMVRRETGGLEQVRRLVTGDELPTDHWAPGLLALYTELGMTAAASRLLGWLLDQQLPRYERPRSGPGSSPFSSRPPWRWRTPTRPAGCAGRCWSTPV